MIERRKPTKIDNAYMARLYGLRYGYHDPAAVMYRRRAKWDRIYTLAGEVATVALWLGVGWLWLWATCTF